MEQSTHDNSPRWHSAIPYLALVVLILVLMAVPNIFEPVVRDDVDQDIEIPKNLLHEMQVKAAYNDEAIFFRFNLPTEEPAW
jgi:hypothetical protein